MRETELINKLRQIDRYQQKVTDLIHEIEDSDHPRAAEIAEELWQQCWFAASAEHVAHRFLDQVRWAMTAPPGRAYGHIVSRIWAKRHNVAVRD